VDRALLLSMDRLRASADLPAFDPADLLHRYDLYRSTLLALAGYRPRRYDGPLVIVEAAGSEPAAPEWVRLAPAVATARVPGDHRTVVREPNARAVARVFERAANELVGGAARG
jgi:thioesterase domain-containing protein